MKLDETIEDHFTVHIHMPLAYKCHCDQRILIENDLLKDMRRNIEFHLFHRMQEGITNHIISEIGYPDDIDEET